MNFMLNAKLGYDKEQVILIQGTNTLGDKIKTFKNEIVALPQVEKQLLVIIYRFMARRETAMLSGMKDEIKSIKR